MSSNRVFFPNLNSIRFLAAFVVIIHHVEMTKYWFGLPNVYQNSFVGGVFGQIGIILFFVLSGFLITYLLLEEHRLSGTIAIKNFYIRRILRIWPVYYVIVIFSFFVFPHFDFFQIPGLSDLMHEGFAFKSLLYLSFLPNLGYVIYEHIPQATQTWSVGVEEQFYLLWPVLMYLATKRNKVILTLLGVIAVYLIVKTITVYDYIVAPHDKVAEKVWLFWDHFSIDCMAVGGIGAYLLFYQKQRALNIIFNRYIQIAVYLTLTIVTVKGWVLPWYNKEWYSILFLVVILNLAANPKTIIQLEYKPFNYLGKISYGLYMYHNIAISAVLQVVLMFDIFNPGSILGGIVFQAICLCVTICISAVSYEYFEKRFLTKKNRYASVESGEKLPEAAEKPAEMKRNDIASHARPQTA